MEDKCDLLVLLCLIFTWTLGENCIIIYIIRLYGVFIREIRLRQPRHAVKVLKSSKTFLRCVGKEYCVIRIAGKVSALYRTSWELRRGRNCLRNTTS